MPEHICYEDDIYAFVPMGSVTSMYYLDINLYHYCVGRDGQTVNEQILISKIDDHIHATHQMLFAFYSMKDLEKEQRRYCIHFLQMMMCIADCVLDMDASRKAQKKKKDLWKYVRILDRELYRKLRYSIYGIFTTLPGSFGRKISVTGYKLVRELYGFN